MEGVKLPIGFRFHPTDEELLIHYLKRKVLSLPLPATVIPEFEGFHSNPWDLPGELKEKRYFFCRRKGNLVNKCSTECGYWKSSGRDKQIMGAGGSSDHVIGMKRSFAFYQGRKLKTQWVMQELCLVDSISTPFSSQRLVMRVGEWCVCRLYQRKRRATSRGGAKTKSKKSWDFKEESSLSCSSGMTEIASSDLDEEASSQC